MSRLEVELFEPAPDPDLICAVCQCVLSNPTEASTCRHVFCHECITTWLNSGARSCPTCRGAMTSYNLRRALPALCNVIGRLMMKCVNHTVGCDVRLMVDRLDSHLRTDCQWVLERCACGAQVLRRDRESHKDVCAHWAFPCRCCRLMLTATEQASHSCLPALQRTVSGQKYLLRELLAVTRESVHIPAQLQRQIDIFDRLTGHFAGDAAPSPLGDGRNSSTAGHTQAATSQASPDFLLSSPGNAAGQNRGPPEHRQSAGNGLRLDFGSAAVSGQQPAVASSQHYPSASISTPPGVAQASAGGSLTESSGGGAAAGQSLDVVDETDLDDVWSDDEDDYYYEVDSRSPSSPPPDDDLLTPPRDSGGAGRRSLSQSPARSPADTERSFHLQDDDDDDDDFLPHPYHEYSYEDDDSYDESEERGGRSRRESEASHTGREDVRDETREEPRTSGGGTDMTFERVSPASPDDDDNDDSFSRHSDLSDSDFSRVSDDERDERNSRRDDDAANVPLSDSDLSLHSPIGNTAPADHDHDQDRASRHSGSSDAGGTATALSDDDLSFDGDAEANSPDVFDGETRDRSNNDTSRRNNRRASLSTSPQSPSASESGGTSDLDGSDATSSGDDEQQSTHHRPAVFHSSASTSAPAGGNTSSATGDHHGWTESSSSDSDTSSTDSRLSVRRRRRAAVKRRRVHSSDSETDSQRRKLRRTR